MFCVENAKKISDTPVLELLQSFLELNADDAIPPPDEVLEEFRHMFERQYESQVFDLTEELRNLIDDCSSRLAEPLNLHRKKCQEFELERRHYLKKTLAKEIEAELKNLDPNLHEHLSNEDLELRAEELRQAAKDYDLIMRRKLEFRVPVYGEESILSEILFKDKLDVAVKIAPFISKDSKWVDDFYAINRKLELLAETDPLNFFEKLFAVTDPEIRETLLSSAEQWLSDRCTSSSEVKKVVDSQYRLAMRKTALRR